MGSNYYSDYNVMKIPLVGDINTDVQFTWKICT